jgi:hypothetical protein
MRSLFAFGLTVVLAFALSVPASAQYGGRSNALGGTANVHPRSHPLGGFSQGRGGRDFHGFGQQYYRGYGDHGHGYPGGGYPGYGSPVYGYPSAYSFFVPNYFDYSDSGPSGYPPAPNGDSGPAPADNTQGLSGAAPGPAPQPIIINQYFGTQGPPQQDNAAPSDANTENTQTPGDPIGSPQNYYLIAYKNHEVYSALAYWVEDRTLHYVTTQNTHNQASLDLIDLPLTKSLNQNREVPFSIPGQ